MMLLSEKIAALRKRAEWSQEELAEKLGVSRQSVGKWEAGISVPDLERILQLAELFGVSTDYLLHDEAEQPPFVAQSESDEGPCRTVGAEEADAFLRVKSGAARIIALSVAACICSPIPVLLLEGLHEYQGILSEQLAEAVGVGTLLLIVGCAVIGLISQAMRLEPFRSLERDSFRLGYGVEAIVRRRMSEFAGTRRVLLCVGVFLCIVSPVPVLFGGSEFQELIGIAQLLLFVAGGVFCLVYAGVRHEACQMLLQEGDYTARKKALRRRDHFPAIYWCSITAVYLAVSFLCGAWDRTWSIWPVAGLVFAVIQAIRAARRGDPIDD